MANAQDRVLAGLGQSSAPASVMRCNAFHAFGEQVAGGPLAAVATAEDPDHPLAFVDHGQSADLQRLLVPYRLGEVILIAATMDAWCHHLARRGAAGIKVFLRQPFAYDVAVGHHADQVIILANRNGADIMGTSSGIQARCIRATAAP
jgi:hypothetical protein